MAQYKFTVIDVTNGSLLDVNEGAESITMLVVGNTVKVIKTERIWTEDEKKAHADEQELMDSLMRKADAGMFSETFDRTEFEFDNE